MQTLNIADLALAILWLFFGLRGYLRGLVKEVGSLAALVMGFYCAGTYHKLLAPHLTRYISGNYADTAAYLLIFTTALLGVWFLALAISGIVKITMTQWADRMFGGAFGLLKGMILTAVLLYLLHLALPEPDFLKGSMLVPALEQYSAKLVHYIPPDINDKLRNMGKKDLPEAITRPLSERKPAAPDKKPAPQTAPEAEKRPNAQARPDTEKKTTEPGRAEPRKEQADNKPAPKTAADTPHPAPQ